MCFFLGGSSSSLQGGVFLFFSVMLFLRQVFVLFIIFHSTGSRFGSRNGSVGFQINDGCIDLGT